MGSSRSTSAGRSLRHAVAAALLAALVLSRRWHLPGAAAQPADGWHEEPEPLDVRVGLLANDNKPFTQPSPQAQPNSAGLEGFEVRPAGGGWRQRHAAPAAIVSAAA